MKHSREAPLKESRAFQSRGRQTEETDLLKDAFLAHIHYCKTLKSKENKIKHTKKKPQPNENNPTKILQ